MKRLLFIVMALALVAFVLTPAFGQSLTAAQQANLKASLAVDTSVLKSADGQLLLVPSAPTTATVPARPRGPEQACRHGRHALVRHGVGGLERNPDQPSEVARRRRHRQESHHDRPRRSPLDHGLHQLGAKKVADVYKWDFKALSPNWDQGRPGPADRPGDQREAGHDSPHPARREGRCPAGAQDQRGGYPPAHVQHPARQRGAELLPGLDRPG